MVKFIGHSKEKIVSKKKQKRDIISFTQEKYQVGCSVFVHHVHYYHHKDHHCETLVLQ